uniref:Uncharacterized protein n=1 Tax=Glossina pallidipes TaxID=7398 RepID=A0A1A9ZTY7_GLOPL
MPFTSFSISCSCMRSIKICYDFLDHDMLFFTFRSSIVIEVAAKLYDLDTRHKKSRKTILTYVIQDNFPITVENRSRFNKGLVLRLVVVRAIVALEKQSNCESRYKVQHGAALVEFKNSTDKITMITEDITTTIDYLSISAKLLLKSSLSYESRNEVYHRYFCKHHHHNHHQHHHRHRHRHNYRGGNKLLYMEESSNRMLAFMHSEEFCIEKKIKANKKTLGNSEIFCLATSAT